MQCATNFSEYIDRVKAYLSANGFAMRQNVALPSQHIDLFGVKEFQGNFWLTGLAYLLSCSIQNKENCDADYLEAFVSENLDFACSPDFKASIALPVILTFPVIVSSAFSDELIKKVVEYKPKNRFFRTWFGSTPLTYSERLSHPILVNISSKQIYHNDKRITGMFQYHKLFNQVVSDTLSF